MGGSISLDKYCEGIFGSNKVHEGFVVQGEACVNCVKRDNASGGSSAHDFMGECGSGFHRRGQVTDRQVPNNSGGVPALEDGQASRFIVRDYEAILASVNDTGRINAGDIQSTDDARAIVSTLLLCKARENATTA